MSIDIDFTSWILWIILIFIVFFIIWYFFSSKNTEVKDKDEIQECISEQYVFNENRKFGSVANKLLCKIFEEYLDREVKLNYRPDFLKNPETKRNLEYDLYDPISKVAIEYNGEQHYVYPHKFHKNYKKFEDQVFRDSLKEKLSYENGDILVVIPYYIDVAIYDEKKKKYILCDDLSEETREKKLKKHLIPILDKIFKSTV